MNAAERALTVLRFADLENQAIPGNLDLAHLQQIHRFLFQDVYDWAGKLRTVNIAKGSLFCNWNYIVSGSKPIFDRLKPENYLIGTTPEGICDKLAYYLGEINVIHPFREGNGRAQRGFIQYLACTAGYHVDFTSISSNEMIEASASASTATIEK